MESDVSGVLAEVNNLRYAGDLPCAPAKKLGLEARKRTAGGVPLDEARSAFIVCI
jgi:hypothetical protein